MITENLSTLKINKLTQEQYDRELAAGKIAPTELYLTPCEDYATEDFVTEKIAEAKLGGVSSLQDLGVTATANELNKLDGVTASTSELNKLDGATVSTTEINYLKGVTSKIQTQLDGKANRTEIPSLDGYATEDFVTGKIAEAELSGEDIDLSLYAKKSEVPTKTSQLTNDSGFVTAANVETSINNAKQYADEIEEEANRYTDQEIGNHDHDERYYTTTQIDTKFANISGGGSAGMVREFESGVTTGATITNNTLVFAGNVSKIYTVTVEAIESNGDSTSTAYYHTFTVDYKTLQSTIGRSYFYHKFPTKTCYLEAYVDSSKRVHFELNGNLTSSTNVSLYKVCGYY